MRPFNTYGPRQSLRALIPTIITQIAHGNTRIRLGSVYPTRDFGFVKDVVKGFIAAGDSADTIGQVLNLGSNFEISVADTAFLIGELVVRRVEIQTEQKRIGPKKSEVERLWADNSRAKELMGWKPSYGGIGGFRKGLSERIKWFSAPDSLKRYTVGNYVV